MKNILSTLLTFTLFSHTLHAQTDAFDIYDWMDTLKGEWVLSPAEKQIATESYKSKALVSLVGSSSIPAMVFKNIGRNSTIQEDLLPNTKKQMVTMYHCKDIECNDLKATHYCVKQNQPEFIANLKESTPTRIVFDCDMNTEVCKSDEDHVHTIIHEITQNGQHLKSSYLSWADKKPKKISSIYHFDRKKSK
ncbi:MAG: hypothetical protein Q9M32_02525 [Sulfurimonas sp.]|nr:hypothetical protein [Sulfurimonas sp.]MDQ7061161.1 hypothetical protein [Sulfurimonas sp.]